MTSQEPTRPPTDPWIDRIVDGRYRVVERVGRGGMGVVYKVEHVRIGKIAALKVLHANLSADPAVSKRFRVEAEAISKLNHPNIVQVFDFGQAQDTLYLVMEYLRGETLGRILKRDGPLPVRRLVPIIAQVCDALTEAHELGIVHRDLKPENIQLSRTRAGQDFVKVLDFGLAKVIDKAKPGDDSIHGNIVGTPYYMAPEQIRGKQIDHRCDIYSLGAVTYRLVTGHHAFSAKSPVGVLTKHITEELVAASRTAPELDLPQALDTVLARAMAKSADDRYATAHDLKLALAAAASMSLSGEVPLPSSDDTPISMRIGRRAADSAELDVAGLPTVPLDVPTPERLTRADLRFERRLRRSLALKLLLVLLLFGGAAFAAYWFMVRKSPRTAPPHEIEPNNDPAHATWTRPDKPVSGQIGKRISKRESDRDWYRLDVRGDGPQLLYARVTGLPNMDIKLELYDRLGDRITAADSTPRGGAEVLPDWPLQPDTYYLLVREVWRMGSPPTENVTDNYQLVTRWKKLSDDSEREPNDDRKQATTIAVGRPMRGFLGAVDDRDSYRLEQAKGTFAGSVTPIKNVDIVVEVWSSGDRDPVKFDVKRGSGAERMRGIHGDGRRPIYVRVSRKQRGKPASGDVAGLEVPYVLLLERSK